MFLNKRRFFAVTCIAAVASIAAAAFAFPGQAACVVVETAGLHTLNDGLLTDSALQADHLRYSQLVGDARARIQATFGAVKSKPILVFFNGMGIGPFKLNSHGSTQMIGSRTCVMIGPEGQSVDVVAHELMHSELHYRAGALQVPVWFDEGVAMQVDHRDRYTLSAQKNGHSDCVRALATASSFFVADDEVLTRNYACAKEVVASWVARTGSAALYPRLDALKNGAPFAKVFPEQELSLRSSESLPAAGP